jgi:hypothetical protein
MASGDFRASDPVHALASVGGVTLFYFLIVPMLRLVWDRDPLDPAVVTERVAAARDVLLHGLTRAASPKEAIS